MIFRVHFTVDNGEAQSDDIDAKTAEDARKVIIARYKGTQHTVQLRKTKVLR